MQGEQMLLENGTDRLAECRVATKLQFGKNTVSVKGNDIKCACTTLVLPLPHPNELPSGRDYSYLGLNFLICKMGGNCSYFTG